MMEQLRWLPPPSGSCIGCDFEATASARGPHDRVSYKLQLCCPSSAPE